MQKYIRGCFAALVHNIQADGCWKWRDECLCVCLDWKKCIKHEDISIKMWLGHSPDVSVLNSFFCSLNFPTRDRLIESGPLCERVCISLLDHLPPWRRLCYPFLPPPPPPTPHPLKSWKWLCHLESWGAMFGRRAPCLDRQLEEEEKEKEAVTV